MSRGSPDLPPICESEVADFVGFVVICICIQVYMIIHSIYILYTYKYIVQIALSYMSFHHQNPGSFASDRGFYCPEVQKYVHTQTHMFIYVYIYIYTHVHIYI